MKRIIVKAANNDALESFKALESVVLSQANVKTVEYVQPGQEWSEIVLSAVPNPNAIGKVYRQWSSKIAVLLKSRPAKQIRECIEKGSYSLGIEGQMIKIEPNMVTFTTSLPQNVVGGKFSGGDLYMDFEITPAIQAEGFARELIRRVQQSRKDMKLDVEEYVKVQVKASTKLEEYFKVWKEHIMSETRCRQMDFVHSVEGEHTATWDVEGEHVEVGLTSLHIKEALDQLMTIPGLPQSSAIKLIESGRKTLADLKPLTEDQLIEACGLSKVDAKKVFHFLSRSGSPETASCQTCGAELPEDGVCKACGRPDIEAKPKAPMTKEKLTPYLLRIPRVNEVKADMIFDSGFDSLDKIKSASKEDLRRVKGLGGKTVDEVVAYAARGGFETSLKCEACGTMVPPDKFACENCGTLLRIENLEGEEESEPQTKAATTMPATDVELEQSFTYLIKEEKSERSYHLFERALTKGMKGFCVTRNYPLKIKAKFNLGETPILWLSNVGKENSIRPKDLEKLSVSLEQFLSQEKGIILLDGLEYLITNNNFLTVLRLVQSLRDQVAINHSILLLAMNPSTLDAHELNLLEKEVDATI
jgi:predicted amidophosphoribosyltransferase